MPLHIFEPRYRQLISDIVDAPEDERGFGIIAIREGGEVMPDRDGLAGPPGSIDGVRALYDVGTFASLREVSMHPDGRSDIVTVGTERFRVLRLVEGKPYAQAEVEIVEELPGEADVALAAAAIGYAMSTLVILALVGRRAWREGPAHPAGVRWFLAVGLCNGSATFLLYAALGLGSIALVAPLVALFPLMAVVMSFFFLRGEQLHAVGLLGIVVSVAGVILLLAGS